MQPQESVTATRRPLDFEDYVDIVRRHKGWIIGPFVAGLVLSVVTAYLWPDTYVSTAVVRIIPPQVPQSLVATNLNMSMQARLSSMTEVILSRATLTNIISTLGLYKKELSRLPMDDVVEQMRLKDIRISQPQSSQVNSNGNEVTAFQISYSYDNRFQAQRVTNELVSRFITENLRDRTEESSGTTQFLTSEEEQAKRRVDEAEQRLSDYRGRNIGRLPDQMQGNMEALNGLQMQITNNNAAIGRVNQEKLLLENQLRIFQDQLKGVEEASKNGPLSSATNQKLIDVDHRIGQLEAALNQLRQRYTESYPDVQGVKGMIASAKKEREQIIKDATDHPELVHRILDPQLARARDELTIGIRKVQAQIAATDMEMGGLQKDLARTTEAQHVYQARIESLPVGEKEYANLMADADMARHAYQDMSGRLNTSQIATSLENRRQGETLELLDPASLPQTPTQPKRAIIIAAGAVLGLVIGLLVAGVREINDTSLKNLKDVRAYTQLAVLGSVPLLENDLVVRRRRRLSWMAWSTACLVGVLIMSGSIVYYYASRV